MDVSFFRYKKYLNFRKKYLKNWGYFGDWKKGEIEIISDVSLFPLCEEATFKKMIGMGVNPSDARKRSRVGIRGENLWGITVAEPVRVANGSYYCFARLISWAQLEEGLAGYVVVPQLTDGRLVFIKTFRNANRSWMLEFPRGMKDRKREAFSTISEEVADELGGRVVGKPKKVGIITPDSGLLHANVEVYSTQIKLDGKINPGQAESIRGVIVLDNKELGEVILRQKYVDESGNEYLFTDAFTLSSLQLLSR